MPTFKGLNTWKMAAALFLLAAFVGVLLLGPVLRKAPDPGPPADVPAMSNVPPPGSLHIEQP